MTATTRPCLEVLHVPDCPNLAPMLERISEVTDLPVSARQITTDEDATRYGMAGSPTLLIDGVDPFNTPGDCTCGVACRIYRDETGAMAPAPSASQLREALASHQPIICETGAADTLIAWRTKTLNLDPVQKHVHQTILRSFATTGRPPAADELDALTAGTDQRTPDVLAALHEADAIRLDAGGAIAVAYPFSATPTRHHVRLANGVELDAMCAIDALGISAMLDLDTEIESFDPSTGDPITITMTDGQTSWDPATAVTFITTTAGSGPSADCCCGYLNFFTNHTTATAWTIANPHIPGQILTQVEAEQLGRRLFGPLLPTP